MAIASMTTSIVGLPLLMCYGLGLPVSIVGAILGHIAKRQIRERGEPGDGMALAGIIMGWIGAALGLLGVAGLARADRPPSPGAATGAPTDLLALRRGEHRGTAEAGGPTLGRDDQRHLARRLVDHLVAEHHRAELPPASEVQ
jgi:hypothetical protein